MQGGIRTSGAAGPLWCGRRHKACSEGYLRCAFLLFNCPTLFNN